jgi:UDP-N-acetylmuramate dehydrogenase
MNLDNIKIELENIFGKENILYNEPMKNHISFKVGGPADILVIPKEPQQVVDTVKICKKHNVPFLIIGNGSNLIVRDGGVRGVVIKLTSLNTIKVDGEKVIVEAGATLASTAMEALRNNLKGMEFASGIPGTVGGAVTMNAGAYGGEIKDIIESAVVMDMEGNIYHLSKEELELSYRSSIIQKKNYVVLEAVFKLQKGNYDEIKALMDDLNRRRVEKQPLNYPSAGSTFKRPTGYFAGKLIEDSGLKGFSIGGAKVSEKHAGFIINYNNATAKDVIEVIKNVQRIVKEKFGVELETEVKIIGEE